MTMGFMSVVIVSALGFAHEHYVPGKDLEPFRGYSHLHLWLVGFTIEER